MTPPPGRKAPATYADIEALPEGITGEILAGELFTSPRPANAHAQAAATLGMDLGSPFQRGRGGPGGWWILHEPELHLASDVLVPDLAGWRRERLPTVPDSPYFTLAPDWLCEVLSPSTARLDRVRKLPAYAAAGVRHAWIVDPAARTLEVFRLEGPQSSRATVEAWIGVPIARAFAGSPTKGTTIHTSPQRHRASECRWSGR